MKYFIIGSLVLIMITAKKAFDISDAINSEFDEHFLRSGQRHGINPNYIKALGLNESWLGEYSNSVTVNGRTTAGIMHIELPTAQDFVPGISPEQLMQPENEIEIATQLFKWLLEEFNNDLELAVRGYNGGYGNVKKYLKHEASELWEKNTTAYWERFNRNLTKLQG